MHKEKKILKLMVSSQALAIAWENVSSSFRYVQGAKKKSNTPYDIFNVALVYQNKINKSKKKCCMLSNKLLHDLQQNELKALKIKRKHDKILMLTDK